MLGFRWEDERVAFAGNRAETLRTETENLSISRRTTGSRSPAGPRRLRDSDAHKRIAVPKALCVLWEHQRPSHKSGKVCRSDTRPGDVCERAERSEGSDTTPHPKRPVFRRVNRCVRSFSESRVCTRFRSEGKCGPFVREVEKRDEKRFETELVPVTFWRYSRERFWVKSRTF